MALPSISIDPGVSLLLSLLQFLLHSFREWLAKVLLMVQEQPRHDHHGHARRTIPPITIFAHSQWRLLSPPRLCGGCCCCYCGCGIVLIDQSHVVVMLWSLMLSLVKLNAKSL